MKTTSKSYKNKDHEYVDTRHKYIEHLSNKPPTTSMRERPEWECTYTNSRNRVLEKARTRTFYFKNVRLTDLVGLKKGKTKQVTGSWNSVSLVWSCGLKFFVVKIERSFAYKKVVNRIAKSRVRRSKEQVWLAKRL